MLQALSDGDIARCATEEPGTKGVDLAPFA